jgi:hypothetical protein
MEERQSQVGEGAQVEPDGALAGSTAPGFEVDGASFGEPFKQRCRPMRGRPARVAGSKSFRGCALTTFPKALPATVQTAGIRCFWVLQIRATLGLMKENFLSV